MFTSGSWGLDVPKDKLLHFTVSSSISSGVYLHTKRVGRAMWSCAAVGLMKETTDNFKGKFSHRDMAANLLGCYAGIKLVDTVFKLDIHKNTVTLRAVWRF